MDIVIGLLVLAGLVVFALALLMEMAFIAIYL